MFNFKLSDASADADYSTYNNDSQAANGIYFTYPDGGGGYIQSAAITGSGQNRTLTIVPIPNASGSGLTGTFGVINAYGLKTYTWNINISSATDPTVFSLSTSSITLSANNDTGTIITATGVDADGWSGSETVSVSGLPTGVIYDIGDIS